MGTIIVLILLALWLGYVLYRMFFDKKHPIGSCGNDCGECHDPLCHLDIVKEYRKDKEKERQEKLL